MKNVDLYTRILEISYNKKLSHLSSCLTMVNILDDIYSRIEDDEPFILSNGHSALALYVVLEKYYGFNAEDLFDQHGVHPNKDPEHRIWASTGSLGHGIGIAVGMALANRNRKVYCTVSDGEIYEGSFYEAMNIKRENFVENIEVHLNYNGFSAYRKLNTALSQRFARELNVHKTKKYLPMFLREVSGHYQVLDRELYEKCLRFYRDEDDF